LSPNRETLSPWRRLLANLHAGVELAFFRSVSLNRFTLDIHQVAALIGFNLILSIVANGLWQGSSRGLTYIGMFNQSLLLSGVLFSAYMLVWKKAGNVRLIQVVGMIYAVLPVIQLVWALIGAGLRAAGRFHWFSEGYIHAWAMLWLALVFIRLLMLLPVQRFSAASLALAAFVFTVIVPLYLFGFGRFWVVESVPPALSRAGSMPPATVNVENVYYSQFNLLHQIAAELQPHRPGITDMYFIGFAGFGAQDVFMKEVKYAQAVMDNYFDTQGRSIVLINNVATVDRDPIASANNLRTVINHVGSIMDPDEDILFLYLTSHGGRDHELAVEFGEMRLNPIDPASLKVFLDEAGIRWRVLVISACYSGGYIDLLRDEQTLVATAAAVDRPSFGCATQRAFTYFGQAVFEQHLPAFRRLLPAFEAALHTIAIREKEEGLPASRPQLVIGDAIRTKIMDFEERLAVRPRSAQAGDD